MKKNILLSIALSISCLIANAQAPEKINYQAVARDLSGTPLVNQSLVVIFQIRQGSPTGTSVYTETHASISTNQFGLFTAEIGGGVPSTGTFAGINWGGSLHYLSVIVDGIPMGTSQLLSVPYALYAKQSANGPQGVPGKNSISIVTSEPAGANCQNGGNKIDVGTDDNGDNILQTLEIDFTYYVCNGDSGTATGDDWGNQVVITQGNNISGDGTTANPLNVFDNDTSATNEIQDLSISGNSIGITGGTGINLSPTAPGTGQVLTWNGTAWIAQNAGSGADNWGTQVVISDATLTGDGTASNPLGVNGILTDNQDLSLTGNTLSLTNDPTPVDLSPYMDNTDAQTLSINANNLSISNGNTVTLPSAPTYTAGTGINLTGNVITNTAPDQTVALNNGPGINVTGTYPNFTINNTSPASSMSLTGTGMTTVSGTAPSFTINTPAQTLTYTAPNLTLSNGGGTVTLPSSPWMKTSTNIHQVTLADNVGIGTTSPEQKLDVIGYTRIGSGAGNANMGLLLATPAPGTALIRAGGRASTDFRIEQDNNAPMTFHTNNAERIRIDGLGNIGIGTTTPTEKLHIQNGKLRVSNGGTSVADLYQTGSQTMLETGNLFAIAPNGGGTSFTIDDGNADFFVQVRIQDGTEGLNRILTSNALGYASWVDLNTISPGATAWTKTGTNIYPTVLTDNIGIGTTTPAHSLHVAGNTLLDGVTQIGGTAALAAQFKVINSANYNLSMLVTGGTGTQLTIQNSSGNVTIGNSTSVTRLFIQDNNTSTTESGNSYLSMQNLANTTNTSTGIRFRVGGTTAINGNFHYKGGIFFNHAGGTNGEGSMVFAVNNIASSANVTAADAAMTISRYGDVGIGTAPSSSYKLTVRTTDNTYAGYFSNSRITTSYNYGIYANAQDATGSFNIGVYARASGAATTNYGLYGYATGGGTNWALYSLGPAYSSTGTWTGSDERLKTNIKSFNGAIEKLTQIDIKTYNFKTEEYKYLNFPSTKQYGVIAQNLEKVFPEMVLESEHFIPNENGDITDQTVSFKTVNYTQLIPVLIKAVQEQQKMIEELQKEIQELKNN